MNDEARINERIAGSLAAIGSLPDQIGQITEITAEVYDCLHSGGTMYTAGNGGSAAQALHLAQELIGRYRGDRPAQRAICLNADPTALTCIANDYGYEYVFSRQVEALVKPVDILLVLTTSGDSRNIVNALQTVQQRGAATIGLLGGDGGACRDLCDHAVVVPGNDSAYIQEAHQVVIHLICEVIEQRVLAEAAVR